MLFYYVACSTDGSSTVVAMFGYFITCPCHNETGAGGDVEGVLPVTACTYDINGAVRRKVYRNARLHKCFAKACQLVYCDAAHLKDREQCGYLCFGIHLPADVKQDLFAFFCSEFFMIEEPG